MSSNHTPWSPKRITIGALFMAMVVVLSSFGLPVPGGHVYLNDIVICLAALLFPPTQAIIIGGVGAFLGDFFFYPAPMFVSLVTHGIESWAIAEMIVKTGKGRNKGIIIVALLIGSIITVTGYSLGRAYIYSTPEYAWVKLPFQILQAVIGAVAAYIIYFHTNFYDFWQKFK